MHFQRAHDPREADLDEAGNDTTTPDASAWRWLVQGARSVFLVRPDWTGLRATPAFLVALCVVDLAIAIVAGRLYFVGPATFFWRSLGFGWLSTAVNAWACWMVLRPPAAASDPSRRAVDAPTLFTMLAVQGLIFSALLGVLFVPLFRHGFDFHRTFGAWIWLPWAIEFGWIAAAQARLVWVGATGSGVRPRAVAVVLGIAVLALSMFALPVGYWQPGKPAAPVARAGDAASSASAAASDVRDSDEAQADAEPDMPLLKLSQETFEAQQRLLAARLDAIPPERPGVVDLYAITFAPYADVDVFMRESAVVADVMDGRFDARGGTLQLVNNVATVDRFAWATPLDLRRAIARTAQRMNRDEDILFLHLTSHGGADGHLAAEFFPLTVEQLTPQMLRGWLDDAGVRNRVISISACFSGSWIAPLANADTLVMTAADADHTSYGCGSKSTLTFFGQAMYDEQLRHTWSFEQAHAASRKLIDQRERAAGKTDGYSNPQISVGTRIRARLKQLEARLAASAAR